MKNSTMGTGPTSAPRPQTGQPWIMGLKAVETLKSLSVGLIKDLKTLSLPAHWMYLCFEIFSLVSVSYFGESYHDKSQLSSLLHIYLLQGTTQ